MTLTRKERESLVIGLLNECTPIREIASRAGLSFRDIGAIKKKAEEEKEAREGQSRQGLLSTQAYKLFSENKTPEEVAIALNLRQTQLTEFYTEHWKLNGLYMLNGIYEEIKGDIGSFVSAYRLDKVAGMNVQHVNRLLTIANTDLPAIEVRYERLKKETSFPGV